MLKKLKTATTSTCFSAPQTAPVTTIPAFFMIRMLIWFALTVLVAVASIVWGVVSMKWDASFFLGILLAALMLHKGLELFYIARKGKYFVLDLECVEITERSLKDARNIWDPTSQTAFRKTAIVSFTDAGGTRLPFIFDASRRFVVGSSYSFYFRRPQNPDTHVTIEMLEQLKIDHEVKTLAVAEISI